MRSSIKTTSSRRRRSQKGNSSLEFALVLPLLWVIMAGIYQLGSSLYTYNQLTIAVSNAARFAGRDGVTPSKDQYLERITNVAVFGNPEGTGTAVVSGLQASNVAVFLEEDTAGVPRNVTVRISNFSIDAGLSKISLVNKPYATSRYAGRYQPYAE